MILSFKLQMYLSHGLLPSPIGFLVENSKSNPALLNYGKFDLLSSSKSNAKALISKLSTCFSDDRRQQQQTVLSTSQQRIRPNFANDGPLFYYSSVQVNLL